MLGIGGWFWGQIGGKMAAYIQHLLVIQLVKDRACHLVGLQSLPV